MRLLIIGDLHAQLSNIDDTQKLFEVWQQIVKQQNINRIVFLGDLYHTHAVLRQEVIQIVKNGLNELAKQVGKDNIVVIAGNHDGVSPSSVSVNAVRLTVDHIVTVVDNLQKDKVWVYDGIGFAFLPYLYDPILFVESANELYKILKDLGAKYTVLFCHQPFQGACYENGFACDEPSPHPSDIMFDKVISGHIHMEQNINKVYYLGTPRQVSISEANQEKRVAIIDVQYPLKIKHILMNPYVSNYYDLEVNEEMISNINELKTLINNTGFNADKDTLRFKVHAKSRESVDILKQKLNNLLAPNARIRYVYVPIENKTFNSDIQVLKGMDKLSWKEMFADYLFRYSKIPLEYQNVVLERVCELWNQNEKA